MKPRIVLTLLLVLLFAAFVAANWSAFLASTTLSLLFTTVQAPLGLLLLVMLGAVVALFLSYMAWWQGRVLLETRRHTKELQSQRELADKAEASRFTELQALVKSECAALKTELQQSANGLAAHIGELEDRLEAQWGAPPRR